MSTTREQFQGELEQLKEDIIKMATLSGEALQKAIDSLYNQDIELAKEIIEADKKMDELEADIHERSVLLIAKQQPVATDLRQIIIALRIVTDLERMGDNAKNIATSTIKLDKNLTRLPEGIRDMHEIISDMLTTSMHAFKYEDVSIARKLAETDDKVDNMYEHIVSELLGETATNPDKIQYIMQVAFCARYLERFADHITNIGESILYLVKGKNYHIN